MAVENFEKFEVSPEDGRGKLIMGNWKRSIPYVHKYFAKDNRDDPHIKRKLNILKAHPEIQHLEGTDQWSIPITALAVGINLIFAYFWGRVWEFSLVPFLLTVYFVGGTMTHIIGVILHEATHNAVHQDPLVNKFMLFFSNLIIPVPIGASFRRYHYEHHTYQGTPVNIAFSFLIYFRCRRKGSRSSFELGNQFNPRKYLEKVHFLIDLSVHVRNSWCCLRKAPFNAWILQYHLHHCFWFDHLQILGIEGFDLFRCFPLDRLFFPSCCCSFHSRTLHLFIQPGNLFLLWSVELGLPQHWISQWTSRLPQGNIIWFSIKFILIIFRSHGAACH